MAKELSDDERDQRGDEGAHDFRGIHLVADLLLNGGQVVLVVRMDCPGQSPALLSLRPDQADEFAAIDGNLPTGHMVRQPVYGSFPTMSKAFAVGLSRKRPIISTMCVSAQVAPWLCETM